VKSSLIGCIMYVHVSASFITYRSCRHLDGKHSVFGRLVGGMEVLTRMEKVETDDKDRPKVHLHS